jgi:flagellar motor protein MotB
MEDAPLMPTRTTQLLGPPLVLALALLGASCVSEGRYRDLQETAAFYEQGYHDYERYVPSLEAENQRLSDELALLRAGAPVPAGFHDDLDLRVAELQGLIERVGAPAGELSAYAIEGGVGYTLSDAVLFDSGSTAVKPEGLDVLARLAAELSTRGTGPIWVRGHTDDVPVKRPETLARFPHGNLQLSTARAVEVAAALIAAGLDPARVSVAGLGDREPLVPNDSAANRARNRRVEIHVFDEPEPEGP